MSTCPRCDTALETTEYLGHPLDACGHCGGRWLDKDVLIALIDAWESAAAPANERDIK